MNIWVILLWIYCIASFITFAFCFSAFIWDWRKEGKPNWFYISLGLLAIPIAVIYVLFNVGLYLWIIIKDGGFIRHYLKLKREKKESERKEQEYQARKAEDERIKKAFLNGEIAKTELPRAMNGIDSFEFEVEMGLYNGFFDDVRDIVYVENQYCQSLNNFFIRGKDRCLPKYNHYRIVYLPRVIEEMKDFLCYKRPDQPKDDVKAVSMDSTYPIKYLWFNEDDAKIEHGLMFFLGIENNHGAKYIKGHYYQLEEGTDEDVIRQIDSIVKTIHHEHNNAALFCLAKKPEIEEGSTDEYAEELFPWVIQDNEVAILVKEVRERIDALKQKGIAEKLLIKLVQGEPKLSKLIITKDMRIILPDYQNMEIKMEPINKAVYFLFLRHPEGIVFKCLSDYRKELAEIYQKIRPLGLNERTMKTIEDVTNPCLNSINEKCARIRGAFISQFDESLAQHYYIDGQRGEAKKIALPRNLVVWE